MLRFFPIHSEVDIVNNCSLGLLFRRSIFKRHQQLFHMCNIVEDSASKRVQEIDEMTLKPTAAWWIPTVNNDFAFGRSIHVTMKICRMAETLMS